MPTVFEARMLRLVPGALGASELCASVRERRNQSGALVSTRGAAPHR
jgi:hypothetical protein